MKLDQELSEIELDGTRINCGGGARLPAVSARAARAGLSGIEFGVNIPGTVGGAVRMNANAYGGELARALEWVDVVSAAGTERRVPEQLGLRLPPLRPRRRRGRRPGLVRARARRPRGGQADAGRHAPPAQGGAALGDQDVRLDLQEPQRPAGRGPQRRSAARGGGLPRAADRGRRLLREARQLRREPRRRDDRRRGGA